MHTASMTIFQRGDFLAAPLMDCYASTTFIIKDEIIIESEVIIEVIIETFKWNDVGDFLS